MNFEKITVAGAAIGCTAANFTREPPIVQVLISVEDNPVRWRADGVNPSSTVGHLLQPGDSIVLQRKESLQALRFIQQGASSGTVMVSYFVAD